jgi:UDP-N-acetylglucosamine acyltransferase
MMAQIDPTAIIDPGAELAADVVIGPYCVIGARVEIGAGSRVGAHAVIDGRTRIGKSNRIFPFCAIGGIPQDKKYGGEESELAIGDGNTIREYCTLNLGTAGGGGVTRIGSDNWIMAYVHVAHDCSIGDHTVIANGVQLGGHIIIGDWVVIGGMTGVHQFVRIGEHAMAGGGSTLIQDLPPFVIGHGNPFRPHGINVEGVRRRGFDDGAVTALRRAYRTLYRSAMTAEQACRALEAQAADDPVAAPYLRRLAAFVAAPGRGIVR